MSTPTWTANAKEFIEFLSIDVKTNEAPINGFLRLSTGLIEGILLGTSQSNCGLTEEGKKVLKQLHLMHSAVLCNLPEVRLADEQRLLYKEMFDRVTADILNGVIPLCGNKTSIKAVGAGVINNYG